MRFIEMISRDFMFEDATRNGGAPNYKCRWLQTQRRFKFFYILNLSIEKVTIKGDTMLKLICATKCSNIHMHRLIHSQDSLYFTLTLAILCGAALPHLKRGTAALEPRHCHDLSDRWGLGGIYTLPLSFQRYSASSSSLPHAQNRAGALSLSLTLHC